MNDMPGLGDTGCTPALIRWISASAGLSTIDPNPSTPFSEWKRISMSGGTKLLQKVGMPTPRLMIIPSWNSLAARMAMVCSSSLSPGIVLLLHSLQGLVPEPRLLGSHHHPLHVDPGRHDGLRVELAQLHHLVPFGDGHPRRAGHHGVEGASRA